MARHEFGIMENPPRSHKRYDDYEPEKYNCISVDDEDLEKVAGEFEAIDFYWHTLDVPEKGLAYCGVTLIPPTSLPDFSKILNDNSKLCELKTLAERAFRENKWMIHYGL